MHPRRNVWPFVGLVVCLFILTVAATRMWGVRIQPMAEPPVTTSGAGPATAASAPPRRVAPPPVVRVRKEPRIGDLSSFATPRRVVRPAPPVAERISFDPSIATTPTMPAPPEIAPLPSSPSDASRSDVEESMEISLPASPAPVRSPIPDPTDGWPVPVALLEQLAEFSPESACGRWADRVSRSLVRLAELPSLAASESGPHLERLAELSGMVSDLARAAETLNERAAVLRAGYALERRLHTWTMIHQLVTQVAGPPQRSPDPSTVIRAIDAVERRLSSVRNRDLWRRYLMLDEARRMAVGTVASATERSRVAREILGRMDSPHLTEEQKSLFESPLFVDYATSLRDWVNEPVDYPKLLTSLERREAGDAGDASRAAAQAYQILRWSRAPELSSLAQQLNDNYRNANVRVAVSGELINRLLPQGSEIDETVDDQVAGARVLGRSRASTRLRVVLLPDRLRWRLGLEAQGEVMSQTEANRGPATFFNEGRSRYEVRKLLLVDRVGIQVARAEADARLQSDLTGLETDFDSLPLVNILARAIVMQQYDSRAAEARSEAEWMLADRAGNRLDEEVGRRVARATETYNEKFYRPFSRLGLEPVAVDMETTESRLVVRYRLAGNHQLGAHTPRPQALGNSLLSVQVHQSALNNTIEQLGLNGKRCELRALFQEIADAFHATEYHVPDEIPEEVTVELAEREAIRLVFDNDRVEMVIHFAELSHGKTRWSNFTVRASYQPVPSRMNAKFARDGHIRLKGDRLRLRDEVALRAIFSKVLAQHPEIDLLGNELARNPVFDDLEINQFVIRDGWIGLGIGPQRRALKVKAKVEG